ncbi:MAG: DUF3842 family protein [Sporolactobacillus sp.]
MKKIAVFDGQGAGLGISFIKALRQSANSAAIIALGSNTYATAKMVRAGATVGISGEKGFIAFCRRKPIDCIVAPITVIEPGTLGGEVTRAMAHAFIDLTCKKYLIPLRRETIIIPGTSELAIKSCIAAIVDDICRLL